MARDCTCDHPAKSHNREAGFYDVPSSLGKCDRVGCPCERYQPKSERK